MRITHNVERVSHIAYRVSHIAYHCMSEEKKIDGSKKYPEPTVEAIIYNEKGEILLIQCRPKWGEYWHTIGGHIETGETAERALKRETKEETGLELDNIEFIGWQDVINPEGYYKKVHSIDLNFCARMSGGKITKSDEMEKYVWVKPDEALRTLKIDPSSIKTIGFYFEHLEKKNNGFENKYKRALADYQNLLKRTAQEKVEFVKYANEDLIQAIIPVYDNLKMSLAHVDEAVEKNGWLEGIKHVIRQFKDVLESMGVEEIKTIGEKFDHNTMEAIEGKGDKVVKELRPGYKLNGKVIVAAKVIVE